VTKVPDRGRVWASVLVLAAALWVRSLIRGPVSAVEDPHPRIAIFGVDAGDWRVIDPLIASGRLPTFAQLKRVGATGVLKSDPRFSHPSSGPPSRQVVNPRITASSIS